MSTKPFSLLMDAIAESIVVDAAWSQEKERKEKGEAL